MLGWSWRRQLPLPQDCVVFQAFSSPMFFFSSKEPVLWDKEPTLWDFWQACTAHRGVLWAEAEGKQGTQLEALPLSKARNKMKSHPVSPLTTEIHLQIKPWRPFQTFRKPISDLKPSCTLLCLSLSMDSESSTAQDTVWSLGNKPEAKGFPFLRFTLNYALDV